MSTSPRPMWRHSRRGTCESGTCVEVAQVGEAVLVRDSKDPAGPVLTFTINEWKSFVAGVRAGDFELD